MPESIPWILLRGLMRDARHWGEFPGLLSARWPEASFSAVDFPGNGARHSERSPTTVPAMVEDARTRLRLVGRTPPYRLLALSLGAMVAACWASRYPEEIDACVLINTSLRPFSPPQQRLRPGAWRRALRLALGNHDPRDAERIILELTSRQTGDARVLVEAWARWREDCPVSRLNALRQLLAAARFKAPAQAPAPPILILASAADALVDVRCSRRLGQQWRSTLDVHARAGHDLPLDDGPWVIDRISRWLEARG